MRKRWTAWPVILVVGLVLVPIAAVGDARAQQKTERQFTAMVTDQQNVATEVKNIVFYWEEKVSDTAFVPHEVRYLPVKRGTAVIHVRFETIRRVEAKPGTDKDAHTYAVTLANGKTGEFRLAIPGSFRGESDFGQVDLPAVSVANVVFK